MASKMCRRSPDRIEDPTGVGDAFRGGFMKGSPWARPTCARGRRGATYALSILVALHAARGTSSSAYEHFDAITAALSPGLNEALRLLRAPDAVCSGSARRSPRPDRPQRLRQTTLFECIGGVLPFDQAESPARGAFNLPPNASRRGPRRRSWL
jgi:hypothetical protein